MESEKSKKFSKNKTTNSEMLFQSENGKFGLKISAVGMKRILKIAADSGRLETGGILLGYYSAGRDLAIVTQVTQAPIDSSSGLFSFNRGIRGIQSILDSFWKKGEYYVGEWHFHPYSQTTPSSADCSQMNDIALSRKIKCPEPILVIVGGNPKKEESIGVFVFPGTKKPLELLKKR